MKKLLLLTLFLGFSATAAITSVDRAEFPHKSILKDSGFETGKAAWAASGGTFLIVTSGSNLLEGTSSATWDSSSAGQTLSSTAVTIPKGLYGKSGEAFCTVQTPSGTATHLLEVFDGSNVLSSVTVTSSTTPVKSGVNFSFPTSGTIQLRLKSVNANEPLIAVDTCYLSIPTNVGNGNFTTEWAAYTPTYTGFGTVGTSNMFWRRVGDAIELSGSFVSGTSTATEARVSLPSGLTAAGTEKIANLNQAGTWAADTTGVTTYKTLLAEPSVSYVTFGFNNGATAELTKQNGSSIVASGTKISIQGSLPVAGWGAQSIFNPNTLFTYGAIKQIGGVFATSSASFVDVSDSTYNTARTISGTAEEPSTANFFGIRVRNLPAGSYEVVVFSPIFHATANQSCYAQISDGTNAAGFTSIPINGTAARNSINAVGGVFKYTSPQADLTFRLQLKSSGGSCATGGFDTGNEQNTIIVRPLDMSVQTPILVGSITSGASAAERFERAEVSSSGTVSSESADWVSGNCSNSSSVYTCTLNAGYFSSTPVCQATVNGATGGTITVAPASATSVVVRTFDSTTGVAADRAFSLSCYGGR